MSLYLPLSLSASVYKARWTEEKKKTILSHLGGTKSY